jgi:hypothetical protein
MLRPEDVLSTLDAPQAGRYKRQGLGSIRSLCEGRGQVGYGTRYLLHRNGVLLKVPQNKYLRFFQGEDGVFSEYAGELLELATLDV